MEFAPERKFAVCPGPDPRPRAPVRVDVPPGAVDTHAHVVGDRGFVESRSFTPPPATAADYAAMLDATNMTYGVLVQVSVHGTDNTLLLDTLRAHPGRLKGVAVVDPHIGDRELAELHDAGVTGLRINTLTGGGVGFAALARLEAICAEHGWHLQLFTDAATLTPARLAKLRVPYVLDHLGVPDVAGGTRRWPVRDLVADGAWVKLSGANRLAEPPYTETVPFARELVAAAPDRCVYGSDWPHVGCWGPMPNDGDLVDLLADWVPDPATRAAVLGANARRLYGFPDPIR
ncbi:amidohydrolase family protein [Amycolatopsis mongoliensis]|uniref:Amidohydrolase family protein n=1 Tax=Amycolatopsis mongoliensis TaxID=715475 RepID=A0A9Y2JLJ7_9PSEU|nr:amidohydrolase family protein [Amycolatopsis sp. 4-36]WIX99058.1 amidohydrolase family protein [Amycolatopsis sp. 4-36]